jgi:hypothetical protein
MFQWGKKSPLDFLPFIASFSKPKGNMGTLLAEINTLS